MINIGIMGFGRVGRDIYRLAVESEDLKVTAVSDLANPEILLYLLNNESIKDSQFHLEENYLFNDQFSTRIVRGIEPGDVPWEVFDVDIVVDATQKYKYPKELHKHINSGAKRVILSTLPNEGIDKLIVFGVNEGSAKSSDKIVSAGSSTANAFALALSILNEVVDINCANMTSIHAYTSDQPLQDVAGKSFRRSRSAAENIIPNEDHSVQWIETILPQFKNKITASALNVPVQKGSLMDLTTVINEQNLSAEDINAIFIEAASKRPELIEITHDPIVSSDVIGNRHSIVFDTLATLKSGSNLVKTLSWYDNGLSHACRILDVIRLYHNLDMKEENK
ncbi:MAG: glyceraldehyde-3-phosphate dehydrogenase [Candidatus Marinimicrobia bacterium]|nr:glyceraldehyde-3-phosphate dehydrogenase [Candidatus Neomarinimicrobiota bacterium]